MVFRLLNLGSWSPFHQPVLDRLLVSGHAGAWWGSPDGGWERLGAEDAVVLPTGDSRWPVLVASRQEGVALRSRTAESARRLSFSWSPSSISDALLLHDRLLVATVGYGVLFADLAAAPPPAAGPTLIGAAR